MQLARNSRFGRYRKEETIDREIGESDVFRCTFGQPIMFRTVLRIQYCRAVLSIVVETQKTDLLAVSGAYGLN